VVSSPDTEAAAKEEALRREVASAAALHYADRDEERRIVAVDAITAVLGEVVHTLQGYRYDVDIVVKCEICLLPPSSGWFVNVHPTSWSEGRPKFEVNVGWVKARAPAICEHCAVREWPEWEADVLAITAALARGSTVARESALALIERFSRRPVRVAAGLHGYEVRVGDCRFCGTEGPGIRRPGTFFACLQCMSEAQEIMWEAEQPWETRSDGTRYTKSDERQLPFPRELLADARAVAKHLRARRERVLGPPPEPPPRGPDDARWDEMRRWFAVSSSYSNMRQFDAGIPGLTPPADLLDLVGTGLARILASEALNGYRQRDKAQFTDDFSVIGDRWVPDAIGSFLWNGGMSPEVRELLDEAMVLLRHALAKGACYMEYDDQFYEDRSSAYLSLLTCLYDFRRVQKHALFDGALLLHGGGAADRLEIAREIHFSRTGGLDDRMDIAFVILGAGEGGDEPGNIPPLATVYIPDPLALSLEEQAWLSTRLQPDGPPRPTILGADDEARFREEAQSRLLAELVPRLYTFELDIDPELARGRGA
jgi:hypothetical protein